MTARTLRERDRARDAVFAHLREAVLGQRPSVAKGDVGLMRRRLWAELVEQLDHAGALLPRPLQNRRAAADPLVLLLNLRRPSPSDDGREIRLKGQRDEIAVVEEPREEVACVCDLRGSAGELPLRSCLRRASHIHEHCQVSVPQRSSTSSPIAVGGRDDADAAVASARLAEAPGATVRDIARLSVEQASRAADIVDRVDPSRRSSARAS